MRAEWRRQLHAEHSHWFGGSVLHSQLTCRIGSKVALLLEPVLACSLLTFESGCSSFTAESGTELCIKIGRYGRGRKEALAAADRVWTNFLTELCLQSKGQSIAMPIQGQPQLVNSQAPIRLTQPQLVTNTGQIISSPTMLTNPALLQAMAAGLQQQVLSWLPSSVCSSF